MNSTQTVELLQHPEEMRRAAGRTIEAEDQHHIDCPLAVRVHEPVEFRPGRLGAADALVHELGRNLQAQPLCELPQRIKLHQRTLVHRRHASVQVARHRAAPQERAEQASESEASAAGAGPYAASSLCSRYSRQ